ncbi:MAG TPA: UTP--glucose-1-phosphate uridylyltransferase [Candidatus Dormibacteraeota bacterium]|nr:UTP--glucose-1-phosphate uridylyltransferase [Candidatus Dormibacteraeota bacterium]
MSTCVIPAAGLGTRFLPATKAVAKELLPVLDRPVIQWAAEEAVSAGARRLVLVLAEGKDGVADHLRPDPELERVLRERNKRGELEAIEHAAQLAEVVVVRQSEPRGLGHAVLCAAGAVDDPYFFCMLPDDLSHGEPPALTQLRDAFADTHSPVIALARKPGEISRYGCADVAETRGRLHRIQGLVEKPRPEEAKSDLAVMGRYVLSQAVFGALRDTAPGALGEIQLTDALAGLLKTQEVWGVELTVELLDVGTPTGWLATNVRLARDDARFRNALQPMVALA